MSLPAPAPSATAGRNTLGVVAISLVAVVALVGGIGRFAPQWAYEAGIDFATISTATGIVTLALTLAAAACALIALRHPRKALAAIALGFCVLSLISTALWGGVMPALLPLLQR